MRKLELQSFRQWLEENKDNSVGIAFDRHHCPIAQYMKEKHGISASVDGNFIRDLDDFSAEDMESWSGRFVRWLDNEHPGYSSVLGDQALKDLDDSIAYWTKWDAENANS